MRAGKRRGWKNRRIWSAKTPRQGLCRSDSRCPNRDIEERIEPDSIVYTDTFTVCNASDVGAFSSMRHSGIFALRGNHVNGMENFWNQGGRRPCRFNGIRPDHFHWFLKECEWRLNGCDHNQPLTRLIYWVRRAGR